MSFARGGCRPQHGKGLKKPLRHKKSTANHQKEWVSTISDLSVHKLTPAELSHRHEIRKSHNKAAAQWELREKALKARLRQVGSSPLDKAGQAIIREVFSDKLLLQDVLARSDRAMAMVKDLLGDPPRRRTGHPTVTVAPNPDSTFFRRSIDLSSLSDSMLDQQALTEPEEEDYYSDEDPADGRLFQRSIKLKNKMGAMQRQRFHRGVSEHRCMSPLSPKTPARPPAHTALNATAIVQRVRSRHKHSVEADEESSFVMSQVLNPHLSPKHPGTCPSARTRKRACKTAELNGSPAAPLTREQSGLGLLQAMLAQVELDLDSLSPPASTQSRRRPGQGLTGFSVALVSTLARLVHLLKNRERDAESAAEVRRKLEEKLREQRDLIDALTAETMTLREETSCLQAEFQQRTAELERKLNSVVLAMPTDLGQPQGSDVVATVQQSVAERPLVSVSPAIQLSSPGQGNARQPIPEPDLGACNKPRANCPTSNLTSIPVTSRLSPEALETEINELCRVRDVIRAQLIRAQSVTGSHARSSGVEQNCEGSGGIGGLTPDRTPSTPKDIDQRNHQGAFTNNSASIVQQRLLELNRESAAARGRLLDLIEQQKRTVTARVSPCGSPVPPSAFSPPPSGANGSADGSLRMLADERRLLQFFLLPFPASHHQLIYDQLVCKCIFGIRKRRTEGWKRAVRSTLQC
ncbi:spindle and centriole-associated protein 1 isoform X2 [Syngnathoides biaculeatus]|uniref:spindle and centriole-associated protein 1 isoform X2 n=1 Tax=Syngnathoides biaculeatus TaxID=300417 RepID=UPI002ADDABF1|nr:spindle and centriole-associated protein 1 isoform X2 [Syngnathoides biaculeatus]